MLFLIALVVVSALVVASPTVAASETGFGVSPIYDSGFAGWTCPTGAVTTSVPIRGLVVFHVTGGMLVTDVLLVHARPNATYFIFVNQFPGDCPTPFSGSMTTDSYGNGYGRFSEPRNPLAVKFWISALTFGAPIAEGLHSRAVGVAGDSD
jgi:hypothetical protein